MQHKNLLIGGVVRLIEKMSIDSFCCCSISRRHLKIDAISRRPGNSHHCVEGDLENKTVAMNTLAT